jgi:HEAT repeat protein
VSRRRIVVIASGVVALLLSGALGLAAARWTHGGGGSGDAAYAAARDRLAEGDFASAAASFHRVWAGGRRGGDAAADAPYWEAFAEYRQGSPASLRAALAALQEQDRRYPEAPTRADARALEARVRAILAQVEGHARPGDAVGGLTADSLCAGRGGESVVAGVGPMLIPGSDEARVLLRQVIARRLNCPPPVRREAVMLLAQGPGEGDGAVLADAARGDPDAGVRREATFWLSAAPTPQATALLDSIARAPDAGESREGAVGALARLHTDDARERLRRILLDPALPDEVKNQALLAIGGFREGDDGGAFLRGVYPSLAPELKRTAIQMIGQSANETNARWLLARAADPKAAEDERAEAVYWAGHTGIPAREIIALYDRMPQGEPRIRVLHALSESGDPAAAAFLKHVAESDPDIEQRMAAREFRRHH